MSVICTSSSLPYLPNEIWIQVLSHLDLPDLWLRARVLNRQWRAFVEKCGIDSLIPKFTIGISVSLGNGAHHRWYDIWATLMFGHARACCHNPQQTRFEKYFVQPDHQTERASKIWRKMCEVGITRKQEWRVKYGNEGELKKMKLPDVIIGENDALYVDWKKLLTAYVAPKPTLLVT